MRFSFAEAYKFLKLNGSQILPDEFIFDYINWDGFPLRFSFSQERDIKTYLEQIYHGIIEKDIITDRAKMNRDKFLKVASYIMANAGKEFSSKNISTFFEKQNNELLEKKMIYRYLDKMEKACLIDRVKRFHISEKQSMTYIEKQYAVDTGFRMIYTNFVNFEDTFFLENVVYNELVQEAMKYLQEKRIEERWTLSSLKIKGNALCKWHLTCMDRTLLTGNLGPLSQSVMPHQSMYFHLNALIFPEMEYAIRILSIFS